MDENSRYEEFAKNMAEKYPRYCGDDSHFGGFAIGEEVYTYNQVKLLGNVNIAAANNFC